MAAMLEQAMEVFWRLNNSPWGLSPLLDSVVRWNDHLSIPEESDLH